MTDINGSINKQDWKLSLGLQKYKEYHEGDIRSLKILKCTKGNNNRMILWVKTLVKNTIRLLQSCIITAKYVIHLNN